MNGTATMAKAVLIQPFINRLVVLIVLFKIFTVLIIMGRSRSENDIESIFKNGSHTNNYSP